MNLSLKKRASVATATLILGMSTTLLPVANAQVDPTVQDPREMYPAVTWEGDDGELYSIPEDGDRSLNCAVDWNAATILNPALHDHPNHGFTQKVLDESHQGQSPGYASLQHWGSSGVDSTAFWRPVVGFDADVDNATVVVTLPAADYSVSDASDWYVNRFLPAVPPGESPYTVPATIWFAPGLMEGRKLEKESLTCPSSTPQSSSSAP